MNKPKPKPFIHTLRANETSAVAIGRVVLPMYFFAYALLGWAFLWMVIGGTIDVAFKGRGLGITLFGVAGLLPAVLIAIIVGVVTLVRHFIKFNQEAQRDL